MGYGFKVLDEKKICIERFFNRLNKPSALGLKAYDYRLLRAVCSLNPKP